MGASFAEEPGFVHGPPALPGRVRAGGAARDPFHPAAGNPLGRKGCRRVESRACAANAATTTGRKGAAMTLHQHDPRRIIQIATRLMGSREKAEAWLDQPRVQLGGRTPRQMLASPDGVLRVEELLAQLDDDLRLGID